MKKITFTLLAVLIGLLFNKYDPFVSRKLLVEYMVAIYISSKLTSKLSNLIDIGMDV